MKTRFGWIFIVLMVCSSVVAQTHITVDNPDTWSGEALRPYIGQTVIFDVPMIICGNANGNYTVSPWRRFQPESHGFVGTAEYRSTMRINSSCMFSLSNVPAPETKMKENSHRCGEKIIGLKATVNSTSSLTMISGTWEGNTRADLEADLPDLGDYRLLVCGFNLENYYMTWGSMGAKSYSEHQDQRAKISKALKKINADIFGLVELQQGDEAIAEIVSDLNANLPGRKYKYFHDGKEGTFQKVDFVYDANTVTPISTKPASTDVEVQNRKKMMCFIENATGERFIYSINHFKAMTGGGEDRRVNESRAVVELYNAYKSNNKVHDNDVLIMGDLNCYAYTSPIQVFIDKGLIDLHRAFHADSSYSYMFSGLTSYIDHAICNETMYGQITGMSGYHINSDEDDKYTYDKSSDQTMFRCSDHDPVLVGLKLDSTLSKSLEPYVYSEGFTDSIAIHNTYDLNNPNAQSYFAIYNIDGIPLCPVTEIKYTDEMMQQKDKVYSISLDNPYLPAELKKYMPLPSGLYILYIYYKGVVIHEKFIVR